MVSKHEVLDWCATLEAEGATGFRSDEDCYRWYAMFHHDGRMCDYVSRSSLRTSCLSENPPFLHEYWVLRYAGIAIGIALLVAVLSIALARLGKRRLLALFFTTAALDSIIAGATVFVNPDNFWWWQHGGPNTALDYFVIGKILFFLPPVALLGSSFLRNRWFFIVMSVLNLLILPMLLLAMFLPYT